MPFQLSYKNKILYMTLDTPNCSVNIFNLKTAEQVLEIMSNIQPDKIRAIVFRSAKPRSFINGVGLLLAQSTTSFERTQKAGEIPHMAYLAIRNTSVPTVAIIQGTCWGCGVEFILNCDYRIAADTWYTQFYMTEINDYLFIPMFDATENLPRTVGLEQAINLLLWGNRWTARKAAMYKLINEVVENRFFDEEVDGFLDRVLRGEVPSCISTQQHYSWGRYEEDLVAKTQARIHQLPPAYHKIYLDCLDLMVRSLKRNQVCEEDRDLVITLSGESALSEMGKSAFSFFYIRQMAAIRCQNKGDELPAKYLISFSGKEHSFLAFQKDLEGRIFNGISTSNDRNKITTDKEGVHLKFVPYQGIKNKELNENGDSVEVALQLNTHVLRESPVILYNPLYNSGSCFFELALGKKDMIPFWKLANYLMQAGFQVAISRPKENFGLNLLLASYLRPLVMYCMEGGDMEVVNFSLRQFGFVHRPYELVNHLNKKELVVLLSQFLPKSQQRKNISAALCKIQEPTFEGGYYDERIIDALCLSLLAAVRHCLLQRCFHHPSMIDLTAREILDFPLQHRSLCNYLTKARVKPILERSKQFSNFLLEDDLKQAELFLAKGKNFYL